MTDENPNFRKTEKNNHYVKKNVPAVPEPDFTLSDADRAARAASNPSSEDLSVKDDPYLSDAEALSKFKSAMSSTVLPNAPVIPGFHLCWVPISSNNSSDTIDFRKTIGYAVVKEEEVPGFISPSNRSAQFDGCVSHNELILMKLPMRLYQMYMRENHHTQPLEQERIIKDRILDMKDKDGSSLARDKQEMTGINRLARKVAEPTFNS